MITNQYPVIRHEPKRMLSASMRIVKASLSEADKKSGADGGWATIVVDDSDDLWWEPTYP